MNQLQAWKYIATTSRHWKTIYIALRHIERIEKAQAAATASA